MLRMIILGAAAGGGFPQWNSNAPACRRARFGDRAARPRTQTSLAVSGDGERWFLLNASPDLRQQIEATAALHPRLGMRSSPIVGVVLTGADVDALAGLLHLRERQPFTIYASERVHAVLEANPIFGVLGRDCVRRERVPLARPVALEDVRGEPSGVSIELFAVPGKVALYLEDGAEVQDLAGEPGDSVGVEVRAAADGNGAAAGGAARFLFVPGCAAMTPQLAERLRGAPLVFFDGTLWHDDEMIRLGLGTKTGRRMGHMSVADADGALASLGDLGIGRKILVHVNNSNPILLDDSPERAAVVAAGWEVAEDGMEITL